MKGWRRVNLGRRGADFWWAQGAGWGCAPLWPDLLMKGWRRVNLGRRGADFWWAEGAGWGCASLWPDLLMKGWEAHWNLHPDSLFEDR